MLKNFGETAVRRIKYAGKKELLIAAAIVLVIAAVIYTPGLIRHLGIERQSKPVYERDGLAASAGLIDKAAGNVLLASSGDKEMYIDTSTLNIRVVDTKTRTEWNSTYQAGSELEKSPLIIRYLGKDSSMYEWDAYRFAIQNGRYTLNQIENGVHIEFDFYETESYRLNEYMPSKISVESYQANFLDVIDAKTASGEMSEEQAQKYRELLGLAYQLDEPNGLYYFKFAGLPPLSMVRDLINFSKAVDYTTEKLIEDSAEFGLTVTITEPARFIVHMEVTLEDGDLVVKIPTYESLVGNDFYMLQNISVFPAFGLAAADRVEDGYILVPDGAGALFRLNTFNPKYPEYDRSVYNSDYYSKLYEMPEYPENLMMPVFGMYYTQSGGKSLGHLGIIEKGAELGRIRVQLGTVDSSTGGTPYNKVFSSFDATQYSRVKVFGPYSDNDARFLATTGLIDVDYTVRYKLFSGKVDYYDLARTYRDYLIERYDLAPAYDTRPKLFLEVLGTLTLEKRFLGIPYEENLSMTTFNELREILEDLGREGIQTVIQYKGVFNNGMNNTIGNKARLEDTNGSRREYEALAEYAAQNGHTLLMNIDLMRVTQVKDGFRPRGNALYGYDSKPLELYKYSYSLGIFNISGTKQYLLHPLYLADTVDKFLADSEPYPYLFVNDMGSTYYANYNQREIIDPVVSSEIVHENLRKLADVKVLGLDNPNIDRIGYARYAANISRESSLYGTMYATVPFRQLVMNGLIEYSTLNVNLSADRVEYFLLQALELGSMPKFTISAKTPDLLKNTDYSDYFSIQYSVLAGKIKSLYQAYREALTEIGSKEITGHEMLEPNVFRTTYASGKSVIVNYNKYPVQGDGYALDALGYTIE